MNKEVLNLFNQPKSNQSFDRRGRCPAYEQFEQGQSFGLADRVGRHSDRQDRNGLYALAARLDVGAASRGGSRGESSTRTGHCLSGHLLEAGS